MQLDVVENGAQDQKKLSNLYREMFANDALTFSLASSNALLNNFFPLNFICHEVRKVMRVSLNFIGGQVDFFLNCNFYFWFESKQKKKKERSILPKNIFKITENKRYQVAIRLIYEIISFSINLNFLGILQRNAERRYETTPYKRHQRFILKNKYQNYQKLFWKNKLSRWN